ncbi:hypothetical protein BaRGS_00037767 [Batillaria attramentaria]|uniref:Uncharacterized protein n=1 Tax=Batillaria attramentaria TaxID=370345 RepID=A0ABD0J873_9CAEN
MANLIFTVVCNDGVMGVLSRVSRFSRNGTWRFSARCIDIAIFFHLVTGAHPPPLVPPLTPGVSSANCVRFKGHERCSKQALCIQFDQPHGHKLKSRWFASRMVTWSRENNAEHGL